MLRPGQDQLEHFRGNDSDSESEHPGDPDYKSMPRRADRHDDDTSESDRDDVDQVQRIGQRCSRQFLGTKHLEQLIVDELTEGGEHEHHIGQYENRRGARAHLDQATTVHIQRIAVQNRDSPDVGTDDRLGAYEKTANNNPPATATVMTATNPRYRAHGALMNS